MITVKCWKLIIQLSSKTRCNSHSGAIWTEIFSTLLCNDMHSSLRSRHRKKQQLCRHKNHKAAHISYSLFVWMWLLLWRTRMKIYTNSLTHKVWFELRLSVSFGQDSTSEADTSHALQTDRPTIARGGHWPSPGRSACVSHIILHQI